MGAQSYPYLDGAYAIATERRPWVGVAAARACHLASVPDYGGWNGADTAMPARVGQLGPNSRDGMHITHWDDGLWLCV